MEDEPILFIGEDGNRSGRLIFTPDSCLFLTRAGDSFLCTKQGKITPGKKAAVQSD